MHVLYGAVRCSNFLFSIRLHERIIHTLPRGRPELRYLARLVKQQCLIYLVSRRSSTNTYRQLADPIARHIASRPEALPQLFQNYLAGNLPIHAPHALTARRSFKGRVCCLSASSGLPHRPARRPALSHFSASPKMAVSLCVVHFANGVCARKTAHLRIHRRLNSTYYVRDQTQSFL